MKHRDKAPRYLNLFRIHLPITAVLSIGHRISGVALALTVPALIYLLALSLQGRAGYAAAARLFDGTGVRVVTALVVWAFAHHALAGMRFLLLDLRLGIAKPAARASAWTVSVGGAMVFLLAAAALL
jgi:succinate dehydrogenase / fumarate reductase cytochrome b subunit